MRKQYFFRPSSNGFLAWDVDRLVELSSHLPVTEIPLEEIRELDEAHWFGRPQDVPTVRSIAEHARLVQETDLGYPVILSAEGRVMDGMHRVAKAYIEGRETVRVVRFAQDPEPDYVDVQPEDLSYD